MSFLNGEVVYKKNVNVFMPVFRYDQKDIMFKGGSLYAVFNPFTKMWETDEIKIFELMDKEMLELYKENFGINDGNYNSFVSQVMLPKFTIYSSEFKLTKTFYDYIKNGPQSYYEDLNSKVIFSNQECRLEDYATDILNYPIEEGSTECWDELVGTLYEGPEKDKIEWLIGSVITGDSKRIQKFFTLYGPPGSGKSTILDIIQAMFYLYWKPFDAARITGTSEFALDSIADNPLIAIQHDGDLSHIINNTLLNSIVSHEPLLVNEKHKSPYTMVPKSLLLLGTNTPVKITDAKSGIKRRLIDIQPSGYKLPSKKFEELKRRIIEYERGAIAFKCLKKYQEMGIHYYDLYEPVDMYFKTDPFFNFMEEKYDVFAAQNYTTLKQAYDMYKEYADDSGISKRFQKMDVRERLEDYFIEHKDDVHLPDGLHVRHYYSGFKKEMFDRYKLKVGFNKEKEEIKEDDILNWLKFDQSYGIVPSKLDIFLSDQPAQYATDEGIPTSRWAKVDTPLSQIDTSKLHYVKVPENLIIIDFDIKNENGEKDYVKNLEAASRWPKTYAELSKSGAGIHLHYLYSGDPTKISNIFADDIEIKVYTGNSSLRRQLTKFNDIDIATINSGLPLKEKKGGKMLNYEAVANEKSLRKTIIKCLKNEIHGHHKPNMDFIYKILNDAYESGVKYDVSDMYQDILNYALASHNQADYCLELLGKMPFKSEEHSESGEYPDDTIVFFDIEVWKNLYIFGYKFLDGEKHILLNPKPVEVEPIMKYKLVGFNCRRYDNHIVYAHLNGYNNEQLFNQSQKIIHSEKGSLGAFFGEAYNLSYTDIYDYSKKKQSLKKWEVELGIYHKEMDTNWDEPLPEDKWELAKEYNGYDLDATEAVWKATQVDFTTRQILADISGGCVNDTDNMLTAKLIFGNERKPQNAFYYRNLAEPVFELTPDQREFLETVFPEMMAEPHGEAKSLLPYFPGYTFDHGKSTYKGEEVGEGGWVYADPGAYGHSKTFDVASMHPHSAMSEYLFGKYTPRYYELIKARLSIKHDRMDILKKLFDGKLEKHITNPDNMKSLSTALKTPINAVYGLTAAKFENKFKDLRNIDNIVAKRGALFMVDLKEEVIKRGYKVIHIKTDSIKIDNPDEYIEKFVMNFGKRYGYTFEVEHEFEKICLVNDAVYIAKVAETDEEWLSDCKKAEKKGKAVPTRWTATGTQFQVPYVFKNLFSKEGIIFDDLCETINVSKGGLYLDFNEGLPDVSMWEKLLELRKDVLTKDIKVVEDYSEVEWSNVKGIWTRKELELYNGYLHMTDEEIQKEVDAGHAYHFIGKVGKFCPIRPGYGGATLLCLNDGKYNAPSGTKGVKWMEAYYVKEHNLEDKIDISYYDDLVEKAISTISQYSTDFIE